MNQVRARYSAICSKGVIFVRDDLDENTTTSVTNDAEQVVFEVIKDFGCKPIIARDTMGAYSELRHQNGNFVGFGKDFDNLCDAIAAVKQPAS